MLPIASGAPAQHAVTFPCQLLVREESRRTRGFASRICRLAHLMEQAAKDKEPYEEGFKCPVSGYSPKCSAPSETSSRRAQCHVLHFALKLLVVTTTRKRSMGPCTACTVVVLRSPRQLAWSNWFSKCKGSGILFSLSC